MATSFFARKGAAMTVSAKLPDGSIIEIEQGATVLEVAEKIGPGLARAALAGKIDGALCDLATPLNADAKIEIATWRDDDGKMVFRHTAAHILAAAVKRLHPGAVLEDGPPTETGFFYDIEMPETVAPEDFPAIEAEMKKIVKEDHPLVRRELSRDEAVALFTERGERFKAAVSGKSET